MSKSPPRKQTPKNIPENIIDIPLVDALGERYLAYALSTIKSRSLPDVRDGPEARSPSAALCHAPIKA